MIDRINTNEKKRSDKLLTWSYLQKKDQKTKNNMSKTGIKTYHLYPSLIEALHF